MNSSRRLAMWSAVYAALLLVVPALLVRLDYSFEDLTVDAPFVLTLSLAAVLAALPFLAAGIVIALAIKTWVAGVGRVYAFDLGGAGLGALVIVPLLWLVDAPTLVVALGGVGAVAALLFAGRRGRSAGSRSAWRLWERSSWCFRDHIALPAPRPLRLGARRGRRALDPHQPSGRLSARAERWRRNRVLRPGRGPRSDAQAGHAAPRLARAGTGPAEHRLRAERAGRRARDRRRRRPGRLQRALGGPAPRRRDRAEPRDPGHGRRGAGPVLRATVLAPARVDCHRRRPLHAGGAGHALRPDPHRLHQHADRRIRPGVPL